MAQLKWSQEAEIGLRNIYEHIARDRPETALRTIDSIINKVESLAAFPNRGRSYPHHNQWQVQLLPYGSFRIAYLLEDSGDIAILSIFNGLIFLPVK